MSNPGVFEPKDFLDLVEFLLAEEEDPTLSEDSAAWTRLREARMRTAVGRAYYAVFLEIKRRLLPRRAIWRMNPASFPKNGVHRLLVRALESESSSRRLLVELKFLLARRGDADYELPWSETHSGVSIAESCLTSAHAALEKGLPLVQEAELDSIAQDLERLAVEEETERRRRW